MFTLKSVKSAILVSALLMSSAGVTAASANGQGRYLSLLPPSENTPSISFQSERLSSVSQRLNSFGQRNTRTFNRFGFSDRKKTLLNQSRRHFGFQLLNREFKLRRF